VDQFYRQVAEDDLLKVPFSTVHDWPAHIARMTHFWWIRFGGPLYVDTQYNPVLKHFHAGFNPTFLERWLGLFHQTLAMNLQPDQCQLWGMLADRMGQALTAKNEYFKRQQQHS
jgi:hemoglobin